MKKCNGNLWAMTPCNRLIAERMESRRHAKHIDALQTMRAVADHHPPMDCPHLRSKAKKQKLQEDRAAEIQLENRILLQKMLDIDTKPSEFSPNSSPNQRFQLRSMRGEAHRRELDRITQANQSLLHRLQSAKPSIDPRIWEEEEMDRQALKYRISQNSYRGRALRLPMPQRQVVGALLSPSQLPQLSPQSARFREDDWGKLTNHELDQKLLQLENQPATARF
jgi:hypothetical protein